MIKKCNRKEKVKDKNSQNQKEKDHKIEGRLAKKEHEVTERKRLSERT